MSARPLAVLSRFPLHIGATDPGKRFATVVGGMANVLDVLNRQVGDVRSAHRLGEAPTRLDLLALADLHAFTESALELLRLRLRVLAAAAEADPIDAELAAQLVNVPANTLAQLGNSFASVMAMPARHRPSLDLARGVVDGAIDAHVVGNGTATALLVATAAYLGLVVERVLHTEDRWWHLAHCRDRIGLVPPAAEAPAEGAPPPPEPPDLTPLLDMIALEENPFHAAELDPAPRRHGQCFRVLRGGLEDVDVTVRVVGVGDRTVRPMVVHVDAGRGVVYEGDVAEGQELAFETAGNVRLAGIDVTGSAWAFAGGVFASTDEVLAQHDFLFADHAAPGAEREATFVVTTPVADALDPAVAFPHGGAAVGPLRLPLGESRWASFVRVAHAGAGLAAPAIPSTSAGRFDASVFGDEAAPLEPSLAVGFAWQEREPFAARVILPRRFSTLDDDAGTVLRQPLRLLLDRHRAAGVDVRVEYADPRWTLGVGVLRDEEDEAIGTVLSGTALWPDGTPQATH